MNKTIGRWIDRPHLWEDPAVVLFSGGQDSTTVLALAQNAHVKVHAVGFDYGQRHAVELECAKEIADEFGVTYQIIDFKFLGASVTSGLTRAQGDVDFGESHARLKQLPSSFVPGRNALMLTTAFAIAGELGAKYLYTGTCQTDYSGYPDCRENFVKALELTLRMGYEQDTEILTPVMHLDKADTFAMANELGVLQTIVEKTNTCYHGDRSTRHDWGYGCGECPACQLRANGWEEFRRRC